MDATLAAMMFHSLTAVKKGDGSKGWTIDRGTMVKLVTTDVSDVAVVLGIIDAPGPFFGERLVHIFYQGVRHVLNR